MTKKRNIKKNIVAGMLALTLVAGSSITSRAASSEATKTGSLGNMNYTFSVSLDASSATAKTTCYAASGTRYATAKVYYFSESAGYGNLKSSEVSYGAAGVATVSAYRPSLQTVVAGMGKHKLTNGQDAVGYVYTRTETYLSW